MLPYKIYYGNDTTYTGSIENAPRFGVVCILQKNHDGRYQIVFGSPYYMVTGDGVWLPAHENDIVDSLVHRLGEIRGFAVGQIVSNHTFQKVFSIAKADKDAETLD